MLLWLTAIARFLPPVIPAETFRASFPLGEKAFINEFDFVTSKIIFVPYVYSYHQNNYIHPPPSPCG